MGEALSVRGAVVAGDGVVLSYRQDWAEKNKINDNDLYEACNKTTNYATEHSIYKNNNRCII